MIASFSAWMRRKQQAARHQFRQRRTTICGGERTVALEIGNVVVQRANAVIYEAAD
jgi:hypothetical protein